MNNKIEDRLAKLLAELNACENQIDECRSELDDVEERLDDLSKRQQNHVTAQLLRSAISQPLFKSTSDGDEAQPS